MSVYGVFQKVSLEALVVKRMRKST